MNFEIFARKIRNQRFIKKSVRFWDLVRKPYESILKFIFPRGLIRTVQGIDNVRICHECRLICMPGPVEVGWWKRLTQEIKEGDTIVEVGAYVGIFTIIFAKRVGATGKVIAFEPNVKNCSLLKKNITLNDVSKRIEVYGFAISDSNASGIFIDDGPMSHMAFSAPTNGGCFSTVTTKTLDEMFMNKKVDLMKIDVEGQEISVISGAQNMLRNKDHCPRFIFIECHPYEWKELKVTSHDLTSILQGAGYALDIPTLPDGLMLDEYPYSWVIFASKCKEN